MWLGTCCLSNHFYAEHGKWIFFHSDVPVLDGIGENPVSCCTVSRSLKSVFLLKPEMEEVQETVFHLDLFTMNITCQHFEYRIVVTLHGSISDVCRISLREPWSAPEILIETVNPCMLILDSAL